VPYQEGNDELLEANEALLWQVGPPTYHDERDEWQRVAWDPRERPRPGKPRQRMWTTIGPTEEQVIRSMAFSLREIAAGRVPK
jgi:hypothetical protein